MEELNIIEGVSHRLDAFTHLLFLRIGGGRAGRDVVGLWRFRIKVGRFGLCKRCLGWRRLRRFVNRPKMAEGAEA